MSPVAGQGEHQEHNLHMNVNLSIIKSWWLAGVILQPKVPYIYLLVASSICPLLFN